MLLPVHTISARARTILTSLNIKTVEELKAYWGKHGANSLLDRPNCGRKTVNEIAGLIDADPTPPRLVTEAEYEQAKMVVALYEEQQNDNSPIPL